LTQNKEGSGEMKIKCPVCGTIKNVKEREKGQQVFCRFL